MQELKFQAGAVIFETGDEAQHLYIVEEGIICMHGSFLTLTEAEREVPFPSSLVATKPDRCATGLTVTRRPSWYKRSPFALTHT